MYFVVENAGYEGECDVKSFRDYHAAAYYVKRNYNSDEIDALHIAICFDRDGLRTYDI